MLQFTSDCGKFLVLLRFEHIYSLKFQVLWEKEIKKQNAEKLLWDRMAKATEAKATKAKTTKKTKVDEPAEETTT